VHQLDDEFGTHGADDPGKQRPAEQAEQDGPFPPAVVELVDQNVHADMDASPHAVSRAEFRHPDEHVDAEFLRPGEIDAEQVGIEKGNVDQKPMCHSDEGDQRSRAHQACDDDFL
jgi:hypothetical protein